MEIRNLISFLRVAELGNYTKAAEDMGYAQPTVTNQIKQLEEEIGSPLFEHIGKKNILTPAGQQLISYANQILQINDNIKNIRYADKKDLRGKLRIGALESTSKTIFMDIIDDFRSEFPNISLEIRTGVSEDLYELLKRNEVDLVFTVVEPLHMGELVLVDSHEERASFVTAPDHPLAGRSSIKIEELFDYPFVLNGDTTYFDRALFKLAAISRKNVISNLKSSNCSTNIEFVKRGYGIAFLGEVNYRLPVEKGSLVVLPVEDFEYHYSMQIYYHKDKWLNMQMNGFIELVKRHWAEIDAAAKTDTK